MIELNKIYNESNLDTMSKLESNSIQCVVTSPPYWALRVYAGGDNTLGNEETPQEYIEHLIGIFMEVNRILKPDGTFFLNIGDTYFNTQNSNRNGITGTLGGDIRGGGAFKIKKSAGNWNLKPKDLCGIPWRLAFALQDRGWWLRNDIIWWKRNAMPEPHKDRFGKCYEDVFLLTKTADCYLDKDAVREPYTAPINRWGGDKLKATGESSWDRLTGQTSYRDRNLRPNKEGKHRRSLWDIPTQQLPKEYRGLHCATFPEKLAEICILAGTKEGDIVYDPFGGLCTTALVAKKLKRNFITSELSKEYCQLAEKRLDF